MMVLKLDIWLDLPVTMTSAIRFHLWPVQTCGTLTVWTGWRRGKGLWHHAKAPTCGLKIFWAILGLRGIISYSGSSFRPLLHPQDLLSKAIHCYRQSCFSHWGVSLTGRMKRPQRRVNGPNSQHTGASGAVDRFYGGPCLGFSFEHLQGCVVTLCRLALHTIPKLLHVMAFVLA